mmetsp:Transcript_60662/g.144581  ORF Transcript_60662/g.144581 Transcript_60662/m.144581 type:complete len:544 (-) Transcript_60662:40-1671(-)
MERPARSSIRQQESMPLIMQGHTSLSFVAQTGLTNFQLLQTLLAVVFLLHAADGAMLPGIFKALEEGLEDATPVSLGGIVFVEAIFHSFAVLVWGVLADRACKLTLLMYATLLWGFVTAATAFVPSVRVLCVVRACAGTVGAALGPVSQGLIGATCPSKDRGRAFGWLIAFGQSGFMLGVLLAGATSHLQVIHGWRGTFLLMGAFTLILSWILYMAKMEVARGLFQESRTWAQLSVAKKQGTPSGTPLHDVCADLMFMLHRPSFWVLVLQGAFASTAVKAMQYQVMWYQYLGFSDLTAASIACAAPLGSIFGAVCGGMLADSISSRYPRHGRILFGQMADFVKIWILLLTFVLTDTPKPSDSNVFLHRSCLSFCFGFFSIMAYAGVIKPLYAEIVPAQMIAQVIALAAALDGAFASVASTPVVGYITQHYFHYISTSKAIKDMPNELRLNNARALGAAISWVTVLSSALALFVFSFLHVTFPQDVRASRRAEAEALPDVEQADADSSSENIDEEAGRRAERRSSGKLTKNVSFDESSLRNGGQ